MKKRFIYNYLVLDTFNGEERYLKSNKYYEPKEIVKGFEIIKLLSTKEDTVEFTCWTNVKGFVERLSNKSHYEIIDIFDKLNILSLNKDEINKYFKGLTEEQKDEFLQYNSNLK